MERKFQARLYRQSCLPPLPPPSLPTYHYKPHPHQPGPRPSSSPFLLPALPPSLALPPLLVQEEEGLVSSFSDEADGEGEVEERVVELEGGREGGRVGGREEGVRLVSLTKRIVRGRWRREL